MNVSSFHKIFSFINYGGPQSLNNDSLIIMEENLPKYTILVPLYKEACIVKELVSNLLNLDYPNNKLEIFLLIEIDDQETKEALPELPKQFRIIDIPISKHRGKSRALNYGLEVAKGDFVTVFDAEDEPDELQLKKAVALFTKHGEKAWALQAILKFNNPIVNYQTLLFFAEYSLWYEVYIPYLIKKKYPVPLGGSSNHMRTDKLRFLGGWDPYNVTEDADLALKIYRNNGRIFLLDSITYERAPTKINTWIKQRTRWIKGLMQTYFVHTRELYDTKLIIFLMLSYSSIFLIVYIAIIMISIFVLGFASNHMYRIALNLSLVSFVLNIAISSLLYSKQLKNQQLSTHFIFLVPAMLLYWIMYILANIRALYQFVSNPFLWEKTDHKKNA